MRRRQYQRLDGGCNGGFPVGVTAASSYILPATAVAMAGQSGGGASGRRGRRGAGCMCRNRSGVRPRRGAAGGPGSVLPTGVGASGLRPSAPSFGAVLVAGPSGGRPAWLQIGAVSDVAAVVRWRFLLLTAEMTPVAKLPRWPCHRRRPVRRRWVPLSLFPPLPRLPLSPHPPARHQHTVTLSTPLYSAFSYTRGAAADPRRGRKPPVRRPHWAVYSTSGPRRP